MQPSLLQLQHERDVHHVPTEDLRVVDYLSQLHDDVVQVFLLPVLNQLTNVERALDLLVKLLLLLAQLALEIFLNLLAQLLSHVLLLPS